MSFLDGLYDAASKLTSNAKGAVSTLFGDPSALNQFMGNYRFPSDLTSGAGRNFYMDIQFRKYQRRSIFNQPFLQANGGIQLPIPTNLKEHLGVFWGQGKADPAVGAFIESFLGQTNNLDNMNIESIAKAAGTGALASGASYAVNKIIESTNKIVSGAPAQGLQLIGRAQNPFLTMLFKQPNFKTYSFSWRLAPRNAEESETIKQIILAFKANMLPALSPGAAGIFLTYPNMAIISFYPAQDFLFKFKPCVVTDFHVNYSDGGMPSFFRGTNAPTLINISIELTEIEYWLREDIVDPSLRSQGALIGTTVNTGGASTNQSPPKSGGGRISGGGAAP